jgi:hypothetical protein
MEFRPLIDNLIAAMIYCPVTAQKVIHVMLAQHKGMLVAVADENVNETNGNIYNSERSNALTITMSDRLTTNTSNHNVKHKCYATVCRLLQAKRIMHHFIFCARGRNMCSGCSSEIARQKQLEREMHAIAVDNDILAPLLQYRTKLNTPRSCI